MKNALLKGDLFTRLSLLIMGFGNIVRKQFIKGLLFLGIEIGYIVFMIGSGFNNIVRLISLGGQEQKEVWNEAQGIYVYTKGDSSLLILLYGIATLFLFIGFLIIWNASIKSAYKTQTLIKQKKHINSFLEDIKSLFNENLHGLLLTFPTISIIAFTILPLVFMTSMAFTNYSKIDNHLNIFNWVGLKNFGWIINMNDSFGQTFWSVLGWTLVWAVLATVLNYILGMVLAMVINRKETKIKSFWRFCFVLSVAVPQFVSLLVIRSMLKPDGIINVILKSSHIIEKSLPFFSDATWARATVIIVNLWVGIPFTMLQVTGILQNIPVELYEAAKVDGAGPVKRFIKITLPYMLFVTTPYLIITFTANINNFNVIYLLTKGEPIQAGATAGKTDLLVTWLYKLTVENQYYNLGAVIGIMTFIILAIGSLLAYRRTGSYKNEEGFQ